MAWLGFARLFLFRAFGRIENTRKNLIQEPHHALRCVTRLQWQEPHAACIVRAEAARGDEIFVEARCAQLIGISILAPTAESEALADRLLRDQIIPTVALDDANHVAIAAATGMESCSRGIAATSTITASVHASNAPVPPPG